MRFFNTTGPCNPQRHYMLSPENRLPNLERYLQQELYFVLHAARQTGKTTMMRAFAAKMCEKGMIVVWVTLEESQEVTDPAQAEPIWLMALQRSTRYLPFKAPDVTPFLALPVGTRLNEYLHAWAAQTQQPLVLLLDEADVISGPALISFLRQLRAGFMNRGVGQFPTSIALIGMRDLRDYLTETTQGRPLNPGSPFNIKKDSLTLRNFTEAEVGELYAQHTQDTGQIFTPEAVNTAFFWTQGQPFLVNALADLMVSEIVPDPQTAITPKHILEAKERLIRARTTHLDALGQRLREERVAKVIQAVLLGDQRIEYNRDDWQYCLDLGLVRRGPAGAEIACPLYREVLVRELSFNEQENLRPPWWKWQKADGTLDMPALVDEFLKWWRVQEQAVYAHGNKNYPEALPHLTFMAFLQRVVNGGGQILREFAAGREAIDLVVEYANERHVLELKRVKDRSVEAVVADGVPQLCGYLDTLGETTGWLIVFDQRKTASWEERLWREDRIVDGKALFLRGA